ncbi:hypothetical protein F5884DRAFT_169394 [Xylogone sp. PMI_703]|nr:hypothetical protein F5884DRAFT_169394 [Xylogone sp. PMI_703]
MPRFSPVPIRKPVTYRAYLSLSPFSPPPPLQPFHLHPHRLPSTFFLPSTLSLAFTAIPHSFGTPSSTLVSFASKIIQTWQPTVASFPEISPSPSITKPFQPKQRLILFDWPDREFAFFLLLCNIFFDPFLFSRNYCRLRRSSYVRISASLVATSPSQS